MFEVKHRPGLSHGNADAVSRRPCPKRAACTACRPEGNSCAAVGRVGPPLTGEPAGQPRVFDWSASALAQAQKDDPDVGPIYKFFEVAAPKPTFAEMALHSAHTKALWHQWPRLTLREGVLHRVWCSADRKETTYQLIVPALYRAEFLRIAHTGITGGHLGRTRTEDQVRRRAYWPELSRDVAFYLKQCNECSRYHRGGVPRQAGLNPFPAGEPFELVSIDVTGPHPTSARGHQYMITCVDSFTKWAEAYPVRNHTAPVVARVLYDGLISRFGCPLRILSDQGPEFESQLFAELCRLLDIRKVRTSGYKASTNGGVERFHRTLNSMLAKVISESQRDWDLHVPAVLAAYRASRHESTGFSPNFLLFGRENRAPIDLLLSGLTPDSPEPAVDVADQYVCQMRDRLTTSYRVARESLGYAAERRKRLYDADVRPACFSVGDWVWKFYPRRKKGRSPKWDRYFVGPYQVTGEIPPCNFVVQRTPRTRPEVVHVDKLKKFWGQPPVSCLAEPGQQEAEPAVSPLVRPRPGSPPMASTDLLPYQFSEAASPAPMPRRQPLRSHRLPRRYQD